MIIVGALVVTGILLATLAFVLERAVGTEFLYVAGAGYWSLVGEATLSGFYLWPNILAIAISASPLVILLISVGFILNSHQIVHNCYIGMTRVMVAMSLDRVLPELVSRVSDRFHTPVNAHVIYFLASIPVIWLFNTFAVTNADGPTTSWTSLTLGVTFACGYVFVAPALPAARPAQPAGLHGGWRDPRLLRPLVHRHEDGASLGRHQRGIRVQGDPAGVIRRDRPTASHRRPGPSAPRPSPRSRSRSSRSAPGWPPIASSPCPT